MTAQPASVEADLNYLLYTGQQPVGYAYPAPPGVPQQSGAPLPTRVRIQNARQLPEPSALDRQGFELRRAPSEVSDFSDERAIVERYYPETEGLRLSFHTDFDDPTSAPDAPPRRSIELRTLVFFES